MRRSGGRWFFARAVRAFLRLLLLVGMKGARPRLPIRCRQALLPALLLAVCFGGCQERTSWVRTGPLFSQAEAPPPGKAMVHVYWPSEEEGRRHRLWLFPCSGGGGEVRRGGVATLVVTPGSNCIKAEALWDLPNSVVSSEAASMEWSAEAGGVYFIRLDQEPGLLTSRVSLDRVDLATALPEIRRCNRLLELTPEEMHEVLRKESSRAR